MNYNVVHGIITRDANSVSWAEIWEFSKSQRDIIDTVIISTTICYVAYYSAAKFTLPIEQLSNMGAKMRHQAILETETETESWLL